MSQHNLQQLESIELPLIMKEASMYGLIRSPAIARCGISVFVF